MTKANTRRCQRWADAVERHAHQTTMAMLAKEEAGAAQGRTRTLLRPVARLECFADGSPRVPEDSRGFLPLTGSGFLYRDIETHELPIMDPFDVY